MRTFLLIFHHNGLHLFQSTSAGLVSNSQPMDLFYSCKASSLANRAPKSSPKLCTRAVWVNWNSPPLACLINDARELKEKIELNCTTCSQPNLSGRAHLAPAISRFSASQLQFERRPTAAASKLIYAAREFAATFDESQILHGAFPHVQAGQMAPPLGKLI